MEILWEKRVEIQNYFFWPTYINEKQLEWNNNELVKDIGFF